MTSLELVFLLLLGIVAAFLQHYILVDGADLEYKLVETITHDKTCFTQGLLYHEDKLYESCGHYGQSTLREVDPKTGRVLRKTSVPGEFFAEGLVAVGEHLYMLTWQKKTMLVFSIKSFKEVRRLSYQTHSGEGWGLTFDGRRFIVSDGSAYITFFKVPEHKPRDPNEDKSAGSLGQYIPFLKTTVPEGPKAPDGELEKIGEVCVKDPAMNNAEINLLNELEWVGENFVYSNVWYKDVLVKIDVSTGMIVDRLNMAELYPQNKRERGADCLNGIAYNAKDGTLLLTGKWWPQYYKIAISDQVITASGNKSSDL